MRDIPVGNGSLLVNFDERYQIRDIYFPHVGQENHTEGGPFRFGVWVAGEFSWTSSNEWSRELRYVPDTLVTDVRLLNKNLQVELSCNDTVASHENIFLRRIRISNLAPTAREFRIFLHHDFRIYENKVGDTAFYDPVSRSLIHYQKERYFLINTEPHFDAFATGRKDFQGQEGTWRDAEDGELHGGPTTEGSVDSTIGVHIELGPSASSEFYYWIAAGKTHDEVIRLNSLVHDRQPLPYIEYTRNYWRAWVNKNSPDYSPLPAGLSNFLKRSLLIVHTQIDNGGAILAANDWDVTIRATDHYSYLWTRDGAFIAHALDLAGFSHITCKFFDFCGRIIHPDGYFLQKYNADGSVASGWHASWDKETAIAQLPIQEDETALVIWALWEHYDHCRDIEFAHRLYGKLTIPAADFMAGYIHQELKLPKPSWNLWENRRGIHTFTCAAVVAGLRAAARFARLFAEFDRAQRYEAVAIMIVESMRSRLYSKEHGRFLRSLQFHGDLDHEPDSTVDASLFGVFYLDCFAPDDKMVVSTMQAVEEKLSVGGGIARFENDGYMRSNDDGPGNPWFLCTLWLADYYIARARKAGDLDRAREILEWTVNNALPSGVLAEQLNPEDGTHVSVSPLTWSHSSYIATALRYLDKLRTLS
jgi:oligosaccharide amylase